MKQIRQALIALAIFTLITGIIYPLFITFIGKLVFPYQANGSIILRGGEAVGSELIGQQFSQAKYFWSRPSATSDYPYNALASGGSNLGPSNPLLLDMVKGRVNQLETKPGTQIPIDLVTTSASGLDPDISVASAYFQIQRVAKARHLSPSLVQELVDQNANYPWLGYFGEPRINVLKLNLALDNLRGSQQ